MCPPCRQGHHYPHQHAWRARNAASHMPARWETLVQHALGVQGCLLWVAAAPAGHGARPGGTQGRHERAKRGGPRTQGL